MKFLLASVLFVLALFVSMESVVANQIDDIIDQLLQSVEANQRESAPSEPSLDDLVDAISNLGKISEALATADALLNKRNAPIPTLEANQPEPIPSAPIQASQANQPAPGIIVPIEVDPIQDDFED